MDTRFTKNNILSYRTGDYKIIKTHWNNYIIKKKGLLFWSKIGDYFKPVKCPEPYFSAYRYQTFNAAFNRVKNIIDNKES